MNRKSARSDKLLIDALGAPDKSGGMQLVVQETMRNWDFDNTRFQTLVVGPLWLKKELQRNHLPVHFIVWPNKNSMLRIFGQMFIVPIAGYLLRVQKYFSFNSVISPLLWREDTTILAHDWRHLHYPQEFGKWQNFYRGIWKTSAIKALKVVTISQKTFHETQSVTGRTDVIEWGLGTDHPVFWKLQNKEVDKYKKTIVSYGLHSNKRPELVVKSFIIALESKLIPKDARLVVLGCDTNSFSQQLKYDLASYEKTILFPGFIDHQKYHDIVAGCRFVVLASTDEGFGLPVVEAAFFGKKTLVSDGSGLQFIHGNKVIEAHASSDDYAQAMGLIWADPRLSNLEQRSWNQATLELIQIIEG